MIWFWLSLFVILYFLSARFLFKFTDPSDRRTLDTYSIICVYSPICVPVAALLILAAILLVLAEVVIDSYLFFDRKIRRWNLIRKGIIVISEQDPYGEEIWD